MEALSSAPIASVPSIAGTNATAGNAHDYLKKSSSVLNARLWIHLIWKNQFRTIVAKIDPHFFDADVKFIDNETKEKTKYVLDLTKIFIINKENPYLCTVEIWKRLFSFSPDPKLGVQIPVQEEKSTIAYLESDEINKPFKKSIYLKFKNTYWKCKVFFNMRIEESICWVKDINENKPHKYAKTALDLSNLSSLNGDQLENILLNFQSHPLNIHLDRNKEKNRVKIFREEDPDISCKNAIEFIRGFKSGKPRGWLKSVPDHVASLFVKKRRLTTDSLKEIALFLDSFSSERRQQVMRILLHELKSKKWEDDSEFYEAFLFFCKHLKKAQDLLIFNLINKHYEEKTFVIEDIFKDHSLELNRIIDRDDFTALCSIFADKLKNYSKKEGSKILLLTMMELLEISITIGKSRIHFKDIFAGFIESHLLKLNSYVVEVGCVIEFMNIEYDDFRKGYLLLRESVYDEFTLSHKLKEMLVPSNPQFYVGYFILRKVANQMFCLLLDLVQMLSEPSFGRLGWLVTNLLEDTLDDPMVTTWIFEETEKILKNICFEDRLHLDNHLTSIKSKLATQIEARKHPKTIESHSSFPSGLLGKTLMRYAPIEWKLRHNLRNELSKIAFADQWNIEVNGTEGVATLETYTQSFLENQSLSVMLLTGPSGTGKTTFFKKFAWQKLASNMLVPQDEYLVVFVSLGSLTDPFYAAIPEGLGNYEISDERQINELDERKVLWIFDGYNEVKFSESQGEINYKNLYRTNQLVNYPNAKFIFICQDGISPDYFRPAVDSFKHVQVVSQSNKNFRETKEKDTLILKEIENPVSLKAVPKQVSSDRQRCVLIRINVEKKGIDLSMENKGLILIKGEDRKGKFSYMISLNIIELEKSSCLVTQADNQSLIESSIDLSNLVCLEPSKIKNLLLDSSDIYLQIEQRGNKWIFKLIQKKCPDVNIQNSIDLAKTIKLRRERNDWLIDVACKMVDDFSGIRDFPPRIEEIKEIAEIVEFVSVKHQMDIFLALVNLLIKREPAHSQDLLFVVIATMRNMKKGRMDALRVASGKGESIQENNGFDCSRLEIVANFLTGKIEDSVKEQFKVKFRIESYLEMATIFLEWVAIGNLSKWIKKCKDSLQQAFEPFGSTPNDERTISLARYAIQLLSDPCFFEESPIFVGKLLERIERQNLQILETKKLEKIPSAFFEKAYLNNQPLDWRFRRLLSDDVYFQSELPYYQSLICSDRLFSPVNIIEDVIFEFLEKKDVSCLLLTGPPGSGKSFFAKKFTWDLLNTYNEESYLPIFVPLADFNSRQLTECFVDVALKKYGIGKEKSAIPDRLREQKILWICDGYDEIAFENVKNIYRTNGFQNWPHSKFLFTSREGYFDPSYFKDSKENLEHFKIHPFTYEAFKDYILTSEFEGKFELSDLNLFLNNGFDFNKIGFNPFVLKVLLHALPKLVKTKNHIDDMLSKIYEIIAGATIIRAFQKNQISSDTIKLESLLNYYVKIAKAISDDGKSLKGFTLKEVCSAFKEIAFQDKEERIFRNACLVCSNGFWHFAERDLYAYFLDLSKNENLKKNLFQQLKSEDGFMKIKLYM